MYRATGAPPAPPKDGSRPRPPRVLPGQGYPVAEFNRLLTVMGWSAEGFATQRGFGFGRVHRWVAGSSAIPPEVGAWLKLVAGPLETMPQPQDGVGSYPARDADLLLGKLGWSKRAFAARLNVPPKLVADWINGDAVMPARTGRWLVRVSKPLLARPYPPGSMKLDGEKEA